MHYRDSLVQLLKTQCYQSPSYGAEVGVHRGRTSSRLLSEFPKVHLYLVDLWGRAPVETNDPITRLTDEQQQEYYLETQQQIRFANGRAEILRMDSVAAVEEMQPLDFSFVDADHEYAGCTRDIAAYWNAVKSGGILCGHDYGKSDLPGVTLAVDEFVQARELELHVAEGNIWWLRKG